MTFLQSRLNPSSSVIYDSAWSECQTFSIVPSFEFSFSSQVPSRCSLWNLSLSFSCGAESQPIPAVAPPEAASFCPQILVVSAAQTLVFAFSTYQCCCVLLQVHFSTAEKSFQVGSCGAVGCSLMLSFSQEQWSRTAWHPNSENGCFIDFVQFCCCLQWDSWWAATPSSWPEACPFTASKAFLPALSRTVMWAQDHFTHSCLLQTHFGGGYNALTISLFGFNRSERIW